MNISDMRSYIDLIIEEALAEGEGAPDVDPFDPAAPVPELEEVPEVTEPLRRITIPKKKELPAEPKSKPFDPTRQEFRLGEAVAREYDPFTPAGTVDMLKEGYARVREHDYTRWIANHELVPLNEAADPGFRAADEVCLAAAPHEMLGPVSHFSRDGRTAYVEHAEAGDILPFPAAKLRPYDPDFIDDGYDPLLDG